MGPRSTLKSLETLRPGTSLESLRTNSSLEPLRSLVSLKTLRPLGTLVALGALESLCPAGTLETLVTLQSCRCRRTLETLESYVSLRSLHPRSSAAPKINYGAGSHTLSIQKERRCATEYKSVRVGHRHRTGDWSTIGFFEFNVEKYGSRRINGREPSGVAIADVCQHIPCFASGNPQRTNGGSFYNYIASKYSGLSDHQIG